MNRCCTKRQCQNFGRFRLVGTLLAIFFCAMAIAGIVLLIVGSETDRNGNWQLTSLGSGGIPLLAIGSLFSLLCFMLIFGLETPHDGFSDSEEELGEDADMCCGCWCGCLYKLCTKKSTLDATPAIKNTSVLQETNTSIGTINTIKIKDISIS